MGNRRHAVIVWPVGARRAVPLPALLPAGWTLKKLLGEHVSHPFNPDVANVFSGPARLKPGAAASAGFFPPAVKVVGNGVGNQFVQKTKRAYESS
jgi:hypothetical protein